MMATLRSEKKIQEFFLNDDSEDKFEGLGSEAMDKAASYSDEEEICVPSEYSHKWLSSSLASFSAGAPPPYGYTPLSPSKSQYQHFYQMFE
ncbi:hypothetical protein GQR58_020034 [Nymphon striatum]|nr:hypothetical protein GQR58_020034 [Nymphon striatum]